MMYVEHSSEYLGGAPRPEILDHGKCTVGIFVRMRTHAPVFPSVMPLVLLGDGGGGGARGHLERRGAGPGRVAWVHPLIPGIISA